MFILYCSLIVCLLCQFSCYGSDCPGFDIKYWIKGRSSAYEKNVWPGRLEPDGWCNHGDGFKVKNGVIKGDFRLHGDHQRIHGEKNDKELKEGRLLYNGKYFEIGQAPAAQIPYKPSGGMVRPGHR